MADPRGSPGALLEKTLPLPVSIAGMHRSGTSMVARILRDAGLYLGAEDELMPPGIDNPEGYWEHADLVALNDAVLAELGGAWDLPPDPPADWAAPRFDSLRTAATGLVNRFAGQDPWGWKDPRNSLTAPFWRSVVGPITVIGVVRNPLEVALSLQKRNQFSLPLGLALWYAYNKRLREDTPPSNLIVTHFDTFFGDPGPEIRRVLAAVDLPNDDARLTKLAANARSGLKHHTFAVSDLLQANVAPEVVDLYLELCDLAGYPVGGGPSRRPTVPPASGFGTPRPTTGIGRVDLWFFEQQQKLAELRIHQLARQELDGRVAERDGMIMEREGKIADRDNRLGDRDRTIDRLTREIAALRQTVADQADQIAILSEQAVSMVRHEAEQRDLLARAHSQLLSKDLEILGTMGGALARAAPGAPAAIYYRHLVGRLREAVARVVPEGANVLVVSYGDPAMLELGRPAADFPQADGGVPADYTDIDNATAIAQLEQLRAGGASYLIVPSPAQAWLARQRELERRLDATFPAVVRELGLCTIYALQPTADAAAAD
jgi:hypothetical protein